MSQRIAERIQGGEGKIRFRPQRTIATTIARESQPGGREGVGLEKINILHLFRRVHHPTFVRKGPSFYIRSVGYIPLHSFRRVHQPTFVQKGPSSYISSSTEIASLTKVKVC